MLPAMNIARRWHAQDGTVNKNIYIFAGKVILEPLSNIEASQCAKNRE